MILRCLVFLLALFATTELAASDEAFPRLWWGTYTPESNEDNDFYQVTINRVEGDGQQLRALASAKFFDDGYIADVDMEWLINLATMTVRLRDVAVTNDGGNYIADGTYTGTISGDRKVIQTAWRSLDGQASGALKLQAVADFNRQVPEPVPIEVSDSRAISALSVTLNPHGIAPLTAELHLATVKPVAAGLIVRGRHADADVTSPVFAVSDSHVLPVLGLYAGAETKVQLKLFDEDGNEIEAITFPLATPEISPPLPRVEVELARRAAMLPGMTLVSSYGHAQGSPMLPMRAFMFDSFGDVRWYVDSTMHPLLSDLFFANGPERLQNGNLYFGSRHRNTIVEMTMLGEVVNDWPLGDYQFHHHVMEMPSGNFLVTSGDTRAPTEQDLVVEVDRQTGEVTTVWDLKHSLQTERSIQGNDEKNWFHGNGLAYDETSDSILVSARFQGLAKLRRDNSLVWIMSPHKAWGLNGRGEDLNNFLLQPLDKDVEPLVQKQYTSGRANHPDFEWNWFQHAPQILPSGDILLFDNGDKRNWGDGSAYSRAVAYSVDDEERTIQQVWHYGKDRGEQLYSRIVSDVDYYPNENRLIMSAGSVIKDGKSSGRIVEIDFDSKQSIFEATVTPELAPFGVTFHRTERLTLYP